MLKVVVVDDDEVTLHLIKSFLSDMKDVELVACFRDPLIALEQIVEMGVDSVFLDVEMPGMNGIELGFELSKRIANLDIVFVTSYENYAVEAFKLNALHYILKPVDQESVESAVQRLIQKKSSYRIKERTDFRIELFGGFRIRSQQKEIAVKWLTAKSEEMFALLLVNMRSGISKWQLMDLLWPEAPPQKAQQNLYTTLFRMKKSLEECGFPPKIDNVSGRYFLDQNQFSTDFGEFISFAEQKMEIINAVNESEISHYLSLYAGDILGDRAYEWSIQLREYCHDVYLERAQMLFEYYVDTAQEEKALKLTKAMAVACYELL